MENQESQIFTEKAVNYASFGQRLGAAIIDGIIVGVVNLLLTYLLSGSILNEDGDLLPTIASVVTGWLYGAVQESSAKQATIGKSLLRIRVTDEQGGRISFGQASGRHFAKIISGIILFIGYLAMLLNDKKQTWHDSMAGTLVVAE